MVDVQTSEMDAKLAPVNVGPWNYVCWHIFKGWPTFYEAIFVKNRKYNVEGSWKLKFIFCFMETNHKLLHLDKLSLAQ
jgi:hypothetical protein